MSQLLTILTSIVLIAGKSHPPIPPCALPPLVWRCSCRVTTRKPPVLRDYSTPAHKGLGMDRAEHSCYAQGLVKLYVALITTALTLKLLISLKDRVSVQTTGGAAAVCKPSSVLEVECASLRGLHASALAACISSQSFCCLLKFFSLASESSAENCLD